MGKEEAHGKLGLKYHTIAGAVSGVFARCVGQPFDVLKIRFQLQNIEVISNHKNVLFILYKTDPSVKILMRMRIDNATQRLFLYLGESFLRYEDLVGNFLK